MNATNHGLPVAPAAERNKEPILTVLRRHVPVTGLVLEIASGTGQHVVHFATDLPALDFQPSEADPGSREVVAARVAASGLANLRAPLDLDVCSEPWPLTHADLVVCINMIHISPWPATLALLAGAARILPAAGVLLLYGPYRRGGAHTAPSNEAFDASLRARNPEWGVRNLETVTAQAAARAFDLIEVAEMPANNLSVVFRRG